MTAAQLISDFFLALNAIIEWKLFIINHQHQ